MRHAACDGNGCATCHNTGEILPVVAIGNSDGDTIDGLKRVRASLCGYVNGEIQCDCKFGRGRVNYGSPRQRAARGEQTGCPEIRQAIGEIIRLRETVAAVAIDRDLAVEALKRNGFELGTVNDVVTWVKKGGAQ